LYPQSPHSPGAGEKECGSSDGGKKVPQRYESEERRIGSDGGAKNEKAAEVCKLKRNLEAWLLHGFGSKSF